MSRFHSPRRRRGFVLPLAVAASFGTASTARAVTFNGNATLTTDYVWRGITQSDGDPAAQAGFKVSGDTGFYASVWGSSVKFAPELDASTELDLTLGWSTSLADDWAVDVNVLRYQYPGTAVDVNWTELNGTLTYRNKYWLSAGWSNEALGYDRSGLYTQVGARFPLNDQFRLEAMVSHYFLSRAVVARSGYTHAQVNAIWAFHAPFELRLSGHATDSDAKAIFGDDVADSRAEAALQASF
ncbi:TorF family putative porin [Dokdonella sp.]|uniref:TorF family putative porin n=1 Tax=Dokdonella sp. TaxID=2291710 RepID=UPI002F41A5E9